MFAYCDAISFVEEISDHLFALRLALAAANETREHWPTGLCEEYVFWWLFNMHTNINIVQKPPYPNCKVCYAE